MAELSSTDLSRLTVKQIKEYAQQREIKASAALRKADLIAYIVGVQAERANGLSKKEMTSLDLAERIQPAWAKSDLPWLTHLQQEGWAVLPLTGWSSRYTQDFLAWLASCCPNFKVNDSTTWQPANLPLMYHGIIKNYLGQTEWQWQIRELCAPIFAQIWSCAPEDLLCSFDGGCFMPIGANHHYKSWFHVDMPRQYTDFRSVQGIVNFEDNGPADGGLVLVERSHQVFANYMTKHPSEGLAWGPSDMSDELLAQRALLKICAPAGSLILFDSRTFHCNIHPKPEAKNFRMATYVAMQPRAQATAKELAKRIKLYESGRMTGHWCYGPFFKATPEHPRSYGQAINRPSLIEVAALNPLRRRLVGYEY